MGIETKTRQISFHKPTIDDSCNSTTSTTDNNHINVKRSITQQPDSENNNIIGNNIILSVLKNQTNLKIKRNDENNINMINKSKKKNKRTAAKVFTSDLRLDRLNEDLAAGGEEKTTLH